MGTKVTVNTSGGSKVSIKNQQQEVIRTVNVAPNESQLYVMVNTATTTAQAAFALANTNSGSSNVTPAFDKSNLALATAQSAFSAANNVAPQVTPAFNQANLALSTAQSAYGLANTALQNTTGTFAGTLTITGNLTLSGVDVTTKLNRSNRGRIEQIRLGAFT